MPFLLVFPTTTFLPLIFLPDNLMVTLTFLRTLFLLSFRVTLMFLAFLDLLNLYVFLALRIFVFSLFMVALTVLLTGL